MSADDLWDLLNDEYLPYRLYADHVHGTPVQALSARLGLPSEFVAERIEAARFCIVNNTRIQRPSFSHFPNQN